MSDTYKDHGHPPGWENEHDPRCQACAQSELASSDGSAFIDDKPITSEWLREMGFLPVPSDLGPQYRDHMEKDGLNIWEFNDSGEWLFNDYDSISMKTRGRLRMIAHLTGTHLPNTDSQTKV